MGIMDYLPQFSQNTDGQDLSGIPIDDAMVQLQLKRKLAMADALRQQEMPQGQMVSGHYVAPSWTQQLAGLANKYVAGQQENEAMKQYGQAQQSRQQKYAQLLGETDPAKFQAGLAQLPEYAPELVKARLAGMNKQENPMIVPAGSTIYQGGKAVYTAPKEEKPQKPQFETFREGTNQVTYQINPDGTRTKVASGSAFAPEKPQLDPWHFNDKPSAPITNSKGWVLHTDAKGNKAYVSPDGKSFEEAK